MTPPVCVDVTALRACLWACTRACASAAGRRLRAPRQDRFKYSSGADISRGGATMSRPRYISAVLALKAERRRRAEGEGRGAGQRGKWEGRRKGAGRGGTGKGREGRGGEGSRGFMKTQPPTLRPLLPELEQDKSACLRARTCRTEGDIPLRGGCQAARPGIGILLTI